MFWNFIERPKWPQIDLNHGDRHQKWSIGQLFGFPTRENIFKKDFNLWKNSAKMKLNSKDVVLEHMNGRNIYGYEQQFDTILGKYIFDFVVSNS